MFFVLFAPKKDRCHFTIHFFHFFSFFAISFLLFKYIFRFCYYCSDAKQSIKSAIFEPNDEKLFFFLHIYFSQSPGGTKSIHYMNKLPLIAFHIQYRTHKWLERLYCDLNEMSSQFGNT